MSENFKYKSGLRSAGNFLVSGKPYLTGSSTVADQEFVLDLPTVSKSLTVEKTAGSGELRVHFGSLSNNAIAVSGTFDFRTADSAFDIPNGSGISVSWWLSGSDGNTTFNATENYISLQNEAGDNAVQLRPRNVSSGNGRLQIRVVDTSGGFYYNQTKSDANLFENGWNHFVLTVNGGANGAIKLYKNGSNILNQNSSAGNPITGSTRFVLFNGIDYDKVVGIDEVAVWSEELSAANVTSLYNTGGKANPRDIQGTNLKLWYQFGDNENDVIDGSNTIIRDSSGNSDDLNDLTNFGAGDEINSTIGPFSGSNNVYRNHHYWPLTAAGSSVELPVKCKRVYLSSLTNTADFQLYAQLTGIPTGSMYELSGSGVDE